MKNITVLLEDNDISKFVSLISKLPEEEVIKLSLNFKYHQSFYEEIIGRLGLIEEKLEISKPKIIITEEMDFITAKKKVEEFLTNNKTSDIEELHQKLHINIEQLIDIIDKLTKEGKINGE